MLFFFPLGVYHAHYANTNEESYWSVRPSRLYLHAISPMSGCDGYRSVNWREIQLFTKIGWGFCSKSDANAKRDPWQCPYRSRDSERRRIVSSSPQYASSSARLSASFGRFFCWRNSLKKHLWNFYHEASKIFTTAQYFISTTFNARTFPSSGYFSIYHLLS